MTTPYDEAVHWIESHPTTGSATRLAKLLLTLWNAAMKFSFRACIGSLDDQRTDLALRMVTYFAQHGEDQALVAAGARICRRHEFLWQLGLAGAAAQNVLSEQWEHQRANEES